MKVCAERNFIDSPRDQQRKLRPVSFGEKINLASERRNNSVDLYILNDYDVRTLTMSFERDLFISYAHIDNLPVPPEEQGWISRFHASLSVMLSQRLGKSARIWRDAKLGGSDVFDEEILSKFQETALLLAVLSPRYVESEWCTRELNEFCQWLGSLDQLKVERKSRIIKVIKIPVENEERVPGIMRSIVGYQFYDVSDDDIPIELDPIFGTEIASKYHVKIAKMAWEIARILKLLELKPQPAPAVNLTASQTTSLAEEERKRPTVYLAECSYDQRDLREALDAELKGHGYRVLPDEPLARDEETYVNEVKELLQQCQLSVHLIGSAMGLVPDGPSQKSILALQCELAMQFSREKNLKRIICLPENAVARQPEHGAFLDRLRTRGDEQYGADLLVSAQPEALKSTIRAALEKIEQAQKDVPALAASGQKLIYLICDQRDRKNVIPLRKYLMSHGYEVEAPLFEGDAATVREANMQLMQEASAILLYYGEGNEAWKRSVESELRKLSPARASAAKMATYTYIAEPATDHKMELVELGSLRVINGLNGFSEQQCAPFLDALEHSGK